MAADQLPHYAPTTLAASRLDAAADRPLPDVASDREWISRFEELKADGHVGADDEASLIRHVGQQRESLEQSLARVVPEYQRRVEADGKDSADRWLAETAREIGEAQGRETRRVVDGLDASQSP